MWRKATVAGALVAVLMVPAAVMAQGMGMPEPPELNPATKKPVILEKVGIDQRIGQQLPLDATFKDDSGRDVRLGEYFGGKKPVVLALAYYECPMLCTQVLNGMVAALKPVSFDAGKDYEVVVLSINPREGPGLAAEKKKTYVEHYGRPGSAQGFHFLTGTDPEIHKVADALGFRYAYDPNIQQYAHGAAIYIVTPTGKVARYLLGLDYAPKDVRYALVEASGERLGTVADQVLLLCYHYDPETGKYGAMTIDAVRIGWVLTVLAFLTYLFVSLRKDKQKAART